MTKKFLAVGLLLMAPALIAGPPVYVLRQTGSQQGIVRFDPESRTSTPFADFIYAAYFSEVMGNLHLTGLADRIVAQGAAYYEFDAGSGQLLRRYAALSAEHDTWAFHAAAVEPAAARILGIAAGYYGTPLCPDSSGSTGIGCSLPLSPFPGYTSRSNLTEQHVLLRRGFDPADTTLTVARIFSPNSAGGSPDGQRFPVLDLARRQFWFLLQGSESTSAYLLRTTAAPIAGGIGDETVVREERWLSTGPKEAIRGAHAFSFDRSRQSFFFSFVFPEFQNETRLVVQSLDGVEETLLAGKEAQATFSGVTSLSEAEPELYEQLLPAVADVAGLNGTYWRSDAWLFNPSDQPMDITLERVSAPGTAKRVALGARQSMKISNVLQELGGKGLDAINIESPYRKNAQLSVYSRTYTMLATGGTYGQSVPAVPTSVGYSNHISPTGRANSIADTYSLFVLDKRDPQQFRHNIGVVNSSNDAISLRLRYAIVSAHPVNDPTRQRTLIIPPHTVQQYRVESLFPDVVGKLPPYIWVSGDKPAALWMSMVDNKTGDATFIPFTLYGVEVGPTARLAIPAVAHTPGSNGTSWRTDGYGVFSDRVAAGQPQAPDVNFYPSSQGCGAATLTKKLTPSPSVANGEASGQFWFTTFADLAKQLCPESDQISGALEVRTGSWMSMVARTYTTREDGGTYGDTLPLYPPLGWPVRHFSGIEVSDQFRVNVGLYNGLNSQSTLTLQLFDSKGLLATENRVTLSPKESTQRTLRELFGVDLPTGTYGLSIIPADGQSCWPYVSLVDNVTGDPTNWW